MTKRTTAPHDVEVVIPEADHRQGPAEVDRRSTEEKYRDLASDVVDLRHDVQRLRALVISRDIGTANLAKRVGELEGISVMDVFVDAKVELLTARLDRVRALIEGNDAAEFFGSQIADALAGCEVAE